LSFRGETSGEGVYWEKRWPKVAGVLREDRAGPSSDRRARSLQGPELTERVKRKGIKKGEGEGEKL